MKLRVIQKGQIFIPQYFGRKSYGPARWIGFGAPNVKFAKRASAMTFIELVDESAPYQGDPKLSEVVWTNYPEEEVVV